MRERVKNQRFFIQIKFSFCRKEVHLEVNKMVKTKCEVYSRVVGYIRPVSNWNDSKQAEFADRKKFDSAIKPACNCQ